MTELAPLTGTVVTAAPKSVREVEPAEWDQETAWNAAVTIWLSSVKSLHSRAAYLRDITMWRKWCDEHCVPLDDARRNDVDKWRDQLTGAPATVARRMCAVSSFYDYWMSEDLVARNPAKRARRPKVSADPVSISLTKDQAAQLLAYVDSVADLRPGVIVRLLAETGMRVSEMTGAKVPDLGMSGGHHILTVRRKGGEGQQLVIAATTHARIVAYLDGRAAGYLLHVEPTPRRDKSDGQMDRSYIRRLLQRIAREAGLPPEVWQHMHPHVLRHSAATLLSADGVPLPEIQLLLGHNYITTTQRYIHHQKGLDASPTYRLAAILAK